MIRIRPFEEADWPAIWRIIKPVFRAGETYAFSPDISEAEAHRVWVEQPAASFVTVDRDGVPIGTYYIKPNQPALGAEWREWYGHSCAASHAWWIRLGCNIILMTASAIGRSAFRRVRLRSPYGLSTSDPAKSALKTPRAWNKG